MSYISLWDFQNCIPYVVFCSGGYNNNNNNAVLVARGRLKSLIPAINLDTLTGRRKGNPQHKCCGGNTVETLRFGSAKHSFRVPRGSAFEAPWWEPLGPWIDFS